VSSLVTGHEGCSFWSYGSRGVTGISSFWCLKARFSAVFRRFWGVSTALGQSLEVTGHLSTQSSRLWISLSNLSQRRHLMSAINTVNTVDQTIATYANAKAGPLFSL
jgi:hypothetical protein